MHICLFAYALAGIAKRVQNWKRGLVSQKKGDLMLITKSIGKRNFVLAYHLAKYSMSGEEWTERSRVIARNAAGALFQASDCAVVLRVRKSRETTFDGLSFHRFGTAPSGVPLAP
jgi:hypothetical protein